MFRRKSNIIVSRVLVFLMVMMTALSYLPAGMSPLVESAEAVTVRTVEDHMNDTVSYYEDNASELNDWEVICALAGAGVDIHDTSKWTLPDWDTDTVPTDSTASKFGTRMLGLIAMDKNPENIWGRNLVDELIALQDDTTGSFGTIFDHMYAMHALEIVGADYDSDLAIEWLLDQQDTVNGGFGYSAGTSDPDATGMVLRLLGNYTSDSDVSSAVDDAIAYLKGIQLPTGGFASWGEENANTIAVIVSGLVSVGEDVESVDWDKEGNTPIDALYQFEHTDFSYSWKLDPFTSNTYATKQALAALGDVVAGDSGLNRLEYNADTISVGLRVEGISDTKLNTYVSYKTLNNSDPSVEEVIRYVLDEEGMTYAVTTSSMGPYLEMVDGETAGTFGGYDGWLYLLNGESGMGIGNDTVVDGDDLLFYYGEFAPGTLIPDVSVNPETIYAGDDITFTITSTYDDWSSGSAVTTTAAIEGADIEIDGRVYTTDENGQASVSGGVLTVGTYDYRVTKDDPDSVPGLVRTHGLSLTVNDLETTTVDLRIEGITDTIFNDGVSYTGYPNPTVADVLSYALDEEGIGYEILNGDWGLYLNSIDGEAAGTFEGYDGWLYLLNDEGGMGIGYDTIADGDEIVFYYGEYAPGTLIPEISMSPETVFVGDDITFEITSTYEDWSSGSPIATSVAIEGAEIELDGSIYVTDADGQVTIPGETLEWGTFEYRITKDAPGSLPGIVRTDWLDLTVHHYETSIDLRIEGITDTIYNQEVIYPGESTPTVADVLAYALDQAGIGYEILDGDWGLYLNAIDGEVAGTFEGYDGWLYLLNDEGGMGIGYDTLGDGDSLVFYYGEYAPGTLIPAVSISPETIYVGDEIVFTVTSTYDDWGTGSPVTTTVPIEGVDIELDGTVYVTDSDGQATVTGGALSFGTYDYRVTKDETDSVPGIVRTDGLTLTVTPYETRVDLRIEGISDTLLNKEITYLGPLNPTVADVLAYALDDEGIDYEILDGDWGLYLNSIDGELAGTFKGYDGWLYLLNDEGGMGIGYDTLVDGDSLVFYYGEYAPGTLIPAVSISPETIYVGDDIVFTVTSTYDDWGTGSPVTTTVAIEGVDIELDGLTYVTDAEGQVTVTGGALSVGIYEYRITKDEADSVPGIVRTDWESLRVKATPSSSNEIQVYVAVIGQDDEILYGPRKVTISEDDEHGDTALGALDATGLDYDFDNDFPGLVDEIEGQKNIGQNGWMYSVNGRVPNVLAGDKVVNSSSKILWWYSADAMGGSPDWPSSRSSFAPAPSVDEDEIKEILEGYSDELADGLAVLNEDDMMSKSEAEDLADQLEDNDVSLSEEYEGQDTVIADEEVALLVPEGALEEDTVITVEEMGPEDEPNQFAVKLGSSVYEFGPDGTKFDKPVTISITVPLDEDTDLESLKPAWYDEESGKWMSIPCVIDLETGMITFEIDHFTMFAVVETEDRLEFADVDHTMAWAKDAIEILAGAGVVNGTGAGYEPQRTITRAEFVKIVVEALGLEKAEADGTIFTDVNADDWFAQYVECGYTNDIVTGDPDGSFRPNDQVSRNEIAVVLSRLGDNGDAGAVELAFGDLVDIPEWARPGVEFAYGVELMNGYEDNTFRGANPLTRAEAAVVVYRYMNHSLNNQ